MSTAIDLDITGSWGIYSIAPLTTRGKRWLKRYCSGGERTYVNGALMCKGGDRCRNIVRVADRDGLHVEVNGVDMKGFGGGPSAALEEGYARLIVEALNFDRANRSLVESRANERLALIQALRDIAGMYESPDSAEHVKRAKEALIAAGEKP